MSEEQPQAQPIEPLTYDPAKFEKVLEKTIDSFRTYREDTTAVFTKRTEANKDVAQFNERLMLLALGAIGLSVSALISFVSKFPLAGHHKWIVVSLASGAWIMLFLSALYCRSLVSDCMVANRYLLHQWMTELSDSHASTIDFYMQRMETVFRGTTLLAGGIYDPKMELSKAREQVHALFHTEEKARLKQELAAHKTDAADMSRRAKWGIILFQWALVLLAITSIVLFAGM